MTTEDVGGRVGVNWRGSVEYRGTLCVVVLVVLFSLLLVFVMNVRVIVVVRSFVGYQYTVFYSHSYSDTPRRVNRQSTRDAGRSATVPRDTQLTSTSAFTASFEAGPSPSPVSSVPSVSLTFFVSRVSKKPSATSPSKSTNRLLAYHHNPWMPPIGSPPYRETAYCTIGSFGLCTTTSRLCAHSPLPPLPSESLLSSSCDTRKGQRV